MSKKILVFTGSRADYSLLKNLILNIKNCKNNKCEVLAGTAHYSKYYGLTYKELKKDNIKIDYAIKKNYDNLTNDMVINYISKNLPIFKRILKKSNPDLVVVLGDRFEVFAFSIAAFFLKIPIAHIHGGEVTSGAFDDNLRHSISKFSNFHYVTHETYKKRLIQLGENPKSVFLVGSPGVENFRKLKKMNKKKIFKEFLLDKNKKTILLTFHPETNSVFEYNLQINTLLESIKDFKKENFIITYNNSDPYGYYFLKKIKKFLKNRKNIRIFNSLGSYKYLNLLKEVDLVIGNSSSGMIEAPAAQIKTLNIGSRQKGRVTYESIINCKLNAKEIKKNITNLLYKKKKIVKNKIVPLNTSKLIYSSIKKILKNRIKGNKFFYDVKF